MASRQPEQFLHTMLKKHEPDKYPEYEVRVITALFEQFFEYVGRLSLLKMPFPLFHSIMLQISPCQETFALIVFFIDFYQDWSTRTLFESILGSMMKFGLAEQSDQFD